MLNGDRGKVDYTVRAGDLMTDTHNAPQHMIGIRRRGRMRMQSVAPLSLCKLFGISLKFHMTELNLFLSSHMHEDVNLSFLSAYIF